MLQQMKRIADDSDALQTQIGSLESELKLLQENYFKLLVQDVNLRP